MSSLRIFSYLLIIILWLMHIVISSEILKNELNVTELPVSSTSSPTVCISPIDIIPADVKGEATIPFPEEVRDIKVTLKKKITWGNTGVTLELVPVKKREKTTPLALLTEALTANTTAASADSSTPIDTSSLMQRNNLCIKNSSYCYMFSEIRWGSNNESGSDHYVDGRRSPIEIQHFFRNSSLENLDILGISVRYRIIHEDETNATDFYSGTEMSDYLRSLRANDILLRRKREANEGKIVPGDLASRSDELQVSVIKPVNNTESESIVTHAHMNDTTTLTATGNGSHFSTSEDLALNLSSTTVNPRTKYTKTLGENSARLSYLSQQEFKAFVEGDIREINVTLGDFLLPPRESYYQYRGDYIHECEIKVDWLLYVKEDEMLPSVLELFRQIYSPSNSSEPQKTSHHQMQRSVEVLKWPYPDPLESSGSRLGYFNPTVFLAILIIVLMAFLIL